MSAEQLAARILSDRTNISSDLLRRGRISEEQMREVVIRSTDLKRLPITVDEMGGISLAQLSAKARRVKRRRNTSLIVIDYLQLMSGGGSRRSENRVQEITAITTGLKALAKELRVPILALSQLSRKVEERVDKRPQLADLRESGSIEQDADVVLFVYRDDYYLDREQPPDTDENGLPNPKYGEWRARMNDATGKAEVIIAKHRHGPTGIVRLAFDAHVTRFSNLIHPVAEQGYHHAHRR
jgi:replicative DNA helicase